MFVFGHVCTTADSKIFRSNEMFEGEGVLALMFPDFVSCHDWGYRSSWDLNPEDMTAQLIKAHMIGDAVVHFGPIWSLPNQKRGWAYRRMGILAQSYNAFFERAVRDGFMIKNDGQPSDSLRGWAHTMIEYSVDQYLTDTRNLSSSFDSIRKLLQDVGQHMAWVENTFYSLGIEPSKPFPDQPFRYARILAAAREPDEFHLRGLAAKFGLTDSDEVLNWLRSVLRDVIRGVGHEEMEEIIEVLINVMRDPVQFSYPIAPWEIPWGRGNHNSSTDEGHFPLGQSGF